MSAIELWKKRVEAHHAQSTKAQGGKEPKDFWRSFASFFKVDPFRSDDPVVDRLVQEVKPGWTVLDVGGGAGRFALPLALRCHHVTVVEPSESMVEALEQGANDAGIKNISILHSKWEEVEVELAEVVLCAHVLYGVADVVPFVQKLASHTGEQVLILTFMDWPLSHLTPFWKRVHGEERLTLPALPELMPVLWEMGIYPHLEMLTTYSTNVYESWEGALEEFRQRLYVRPGTAEDQRLEKAMEELLEKTPDGFVIRDATPRRLGLISWRPD